MSAGWVGLIIGCVFAFTVLFAVAMGSAAKRGDRQSRRAIERARALKCEPAREVVVTQDFWPRGVLGEIADEIRGVPYDRDQESA